MSEPPKPDPALSQDSTPGTNSTSATATAPGIPALFDNAPKDVVMSDAPAERAPSPAPAPQSTPNVPSPVPARTGTPSRTANGHEASSRAASVHPDPGFAMPAEAPPHGDSVRKYLNTKVTGVLLEGMKMIGKDQPKDPLRVLGEYLLQRSRELEGT